MHGPAMKIGNMNSMSYYNVVITNAGNKLSALKSKLVLKLHQNVGALSQT